MYHLTRGILGDSLIGSEFANEHLLHSLMKFYIGKCCRGKPEVAWGRSDNYI